MNATILKQAIFDNGPKIINCEVGIMVPKFGIKTIAILRKMNSFNDIYVDTKKAMEKLAKLISEKQSVPFGIIYTALKNLSVPFDVNVIGTAFKNGSLTIETEKEFTSMPLKNESLETETTKNLEMNNPSPSKKKMQLQEFKIRYQAEAHILILRELGKMMRKFDIFQTIALLIEINSFSSIQLDVLEIKKEIVFKIRDACPEETPSVPEEIPSVPKKTPSLPMETTSVPMETTSVPMETTSVPMETSSLPEEKIKFITFDPQRKMKFITGKQ